MGISVSLVSTQMVVAGTTAFGDGNTQELGSAVKTLLDLKESPAVIGEAVTSLQKNTSVPFTAVALDVDGPAGPNAPDGTGKKRER